MWKTDSLYLMIFISGLLGGGGHCIAMCGPLVAACAVRGQGRSIASHLLYTLGRLTTYSVLGGIIGLAGSFTAVIGAIASLQGVVLALAGVAMILMGLATGHWIPFLAKTGGSSRLSRAVRSAVTLISSAETVGAYYPLGLVLGFLPCGLLYTALIAAAGAGAEAGDPVKGFLRGAVLLFLFGLGTAPALFVVGRLFSAGAGWIQGRLYRIAALLMVIMGIMFILRAVR